MKYEVVEKTNYKIIRIGGDINLSEIEEFKDCVRRQMNPTQTLLLNFSKVHSMDNMGFSFMLSACKKSDSNDKKLAVCCLREDIYSLFNKLMIDKVIDVYNFEEEAISRLSGGIDA